MSRATRIAEGRALARDVVEFRGHPMVRSSHPTTIELTTEGYLTENGECIIGVGAAKGCAGLSDAVKERLQTEGSTVTLRVVVGALSFQFRAQGDPRLALSDPHDMVVRKSDYVSGRTLAVRADASSRDLPREMVRLLKNPATRGRLEIEVG
ncbi:MAG: DUF371 domain-containing protein [Nitrososphaerota archaeon]|nr:DUF371 domain-containing protein [Nitrososphaerota archaeon]MDG7024290.1 DUF371 domain-containing protein [Nitrososphaerota archaeon]